MATDYYAQDAGPSANAPEMEEGAEPKGGDESMEETALVPVNVLGENAKVGDVCKFKVVAMHDDEAEIAYVKEDKKPEAEMDMEEHPVDRVARENGEL